jgi:hypothetical protein
LVGYATISETMSDLGAFLMARIAEEEAWLGVPAGPAERPGLLVSDRRLSELVGNRIIVALHSPPQVLAASLGAPMRRVCPQDRRDYPCMTLRALALPYVDHPDYEPDWWT